MAVYLSDGAATSYRAMWVDKEGQTGWTAKVQLHSMQDVIFYLDHNELDDNLDNYYPVGKAEELYSRLRHLAPGYRK